MTFKIVNTNVAAERNGKYAVDTSSGDKTVELPLRTNIVPGETVTVLNSGKNKVLVTSPDSQLDTAIVKTHRVYVFLGSGWASYGQEGTVAPLATKSTFARTPEAPPAAAE